MRAYEDFEPGSRESYGTVSVGEAEMVAFAKDFDPQPMHLDATSAQASRVGGLIASGWFTCARNQRLITDHLIAHSAWLGSPGTANLKWLAPVRPGDHLTGTMEVLGRHAAATPDRGLVALRLTLVNQDQIPILAQESLACFARRAPGTPDDAPPPPALPDEAYSTTLTPAGMPPGTIETFIPGSIIRFGSHTFSQAEMRAFALAHDPQPIHLDEDAARAAGHRALVASPWHTTAVWMGEVIRYWQRVEQAGHTLPKRGPGFGFTDLRWLRPVLADDTLTYHARILEARRSASKPGWGILSQRNYAINQNGEAVFAFTGSVLWGARE